MTERKPNTVAAFLVRTLTDPILLYVTVVMSSIMYHYRSELAFVYGLLTYVIGWAVFRVFDFINKHNLIGSIFYILMLLGCFKLSIGFIEKGYEHYPITFALWFLTPQDSLLYSKYYTMAIFTLFLFFMLSVIYYFTRVRYRIFMNFLIFIIPFAIYGKEYEEMPIGFIIALAVGYVLIMALFRQLSDSEKTVVIDKGDAWKSAAVFTVIFALLSALIPKPEIEADRTALEQLIDADALTDRMLGMLNIFRENSDGEQFRLSNDNSILYYGESPMPLQLKNSTFTYYNYRTDSWAISDLDSYYRKHRDGTINFLTNGSITEAVWAAAKCSEQFAAEYGLEELREMELDRPETYIMSIKSTYRSGDNAPSPKGAKRLTETTYNDVLGLSHAGVVLADGREFAIEESFTYEFEPDNFLGTENNRRAVDIISRVENYEEMLESGADVLVDCYLYNDTEFTDDELDIYSDVLQQNSDDYDYYRMGLLEYGGEKQIYDLAQEITAGKETDLEKARALEWYFIDNDYIYDQTYRKAQGDNVLNFLFDTKKGVCYEYATSMTLLARAAGIPARYCEGFNMQNADPQGSGTSYLVRGTDAHGFPELYIKGYGWMNFEPTMSNAPIMNTGRNAADMLVKYGIVILILSLAALAVILLFSAITHRIFLIINGRRAPDEAVRGIMKRLSRLFKMTPATTAREAEAMVRSVSGADISHTAGLFERSQYGGESLTEADKALATEQYIAAYRALRGAKKAARKNKRRKKAETV